MKLKDFLAEIEALDLDPNTEVFLTVNFGDGETVGGPANEVYTDDGALMVFAS